MLRVRVGSIVEPDRGKPIYLREPLIAPPHELIVSF